MKQADTIIPPPWDRPSRLRKMLIFVAGCITGAAAAVGAILMDGRIAMHNSSCVIFQHDTVKEDKTPRQDKDSERKEVPPEEG